VLFVKRRLKVVRLSELKCLRGRGCGCGSIAYLDERSDIDLPCFLGLLTSLLLESAMKCGVSRCV
jgi:hypothetical protein